MKTIVDESGICSEPVVNLKPEPEESVTAATQLNAESMGGDTKKTVTPNRRTGYRKFQYLPTR